MSLDPIERFIDSSLRSILGVLLDQVFFIPISDEADPLHARRMFPHQDKSPESPEDKLIRAYDLKYHPQECKRDLVTYLDEQKYSRKEIGNITGYSKSQIYRILKNE